MHWAPVASIEWYILHFLWKWSSAQSHWHFLFLFKRLAEQSTAGQLLTRDMKLLCTLNQPKMGVTMTLLVTGKNFPNLWHLPESQIWDNTSASRSSLCSDLSDELCRITQVIAMAGGSTFDPSTDIAVVFLEIDRRVLYTNLPDSKRKVRSSSSVLTSLFGTAAAPHTLCTANSCQVWPYTSLPCH